jgi:hypothetical protein
MSKDIERILKEILQLDKQILKIEETNNRDLSELKKVVKLINRRLDEIADKVKEFEIILDEPDDEEIEYDDTDEWMPYNENNYVSEDYESYGEENNDNDETF